MVKEDPKVKSFLRWVGGKNWLAKNITEYLPEIFNNYHEPFLGGASIFLSINPNGKKYLSDLNSDLISCYIQIRDNVEEVICFLKSLKNSKQSYYKEREIIYTNPAEKASQFIFLNKTSFNGIYRVNKSGLYNVPYGFRENVNFVNEDNLRIVSNRLNKAFIKVQDYYSSISSVKENDLVFLDPPYTVAHQNNGFIEYNQKLFSLEDQERLAIYLQKVEDLGAYFILTNAAHPIIKKIYRGRGKIFELSRKSLIGGIGAKRNIISEYLISNINKIK